MSNSENVETPGDPESYQTLAGEGHAEIKREGSRFLGRAHPVDSEEDAELIVSDYRDRHYDARHVCYGLRVELGAQRIDRSNDDGEPARTGGFPIWQLLSGEELENSLIVVIRYFGGTKLGMGGLKRAYRDAAREALDDAGVRTIHPEIHLRITLPYSYFDQLQYLVDELEAARIVDRQFAADVDVEIAVWSSQIDAVKARLGQLLGRMPKDL